MQRTIAYYAIKSVDKSQKARVLQEVRGLQLLISMPPTNKLQMLMSRIIVHKDLSNVMQEPE